jgi:DNA-3-methyladenine glycosylase I
MTIIKKRENFAQAFDNFDYKKIAKYTEKDFTRLMNNA